MVFQIHQSVYPPDRYYCRIAPGCLFPEHYLHTKQTIIYAYLKANSEDSATGLFLMLLKGKLNMELMLMSKYFIQYFY